MRTFLLTPAAADSCCKARTKGPYTNGSLSHNLGGNSLRRFHMQDMTLVTPQCIQRLTPVNLFIREHSCSLSAVTPSAYSLSRDGTGESKILMWGNSPKKAMLSSTLCASVSAKDTPCSCYLLRKDCPVFHYCKWHSLMLIHHLPYADN